MIVERDTIDKAFARYVSCYSEAWKIEDYMEMCEFAERSFDGRGDLEAFRKLYNKLRGSWKVMRGKSKIKWEADEAFRQLAGLPRRLKKRRLSDLQVSEWPLVCECLHRMCGIKVNKDGPSLVAVSKFLHFWNPRIFVIVDRAVMWEKIFGHRWLWEQAKAMEGISDFAGADDETNSILDDYWRILRWASELIRINPHVSTAFVTTVGTYAKDLRLPNGIATFEATAVEWFLLGLVELPPPGVRI